MQKLKAQKEVEKEAVPLNNLSIFFKKSCNSTNEMLLINKAGTQLSFDILRPVFFSKKSTQN